jgi:serine/threonine protein kinase/tetratricopeptide (TPR) repeat protein
MTSCPQCHAENPHDSQFCSRCGTRISSLEGLSLTRTISPFPGAVTKGESFAGRYEILDELGRGGMGIVYKASDTKLKRIVALKFLPPELSIDPETKDRFVLEAQAAASLDHPSICIIHEIDEADGKPFISMAYIEGQTLRERIRTGPLPEDKSLEIAIQVADGLEEAHKRGIIHRDIKPANVMITAKGGVTIMDFGLAKVSGARATREGVVMGTLAYMSPEQVRGEPADHRSDIWSLGAVIYEMITGSLPFPGDKDALIVTGIQNAETVPLSVRRPGISPEFEHIVKRALAKPPCERYQGAGEMKADMEQLLQILRGRRARSKSAADLLTVIPFDNLADPNDRKREARMISNLVLTALSASGGLRVASEQRLFDGLKEIGHGGERTIDRTVAVQLAGRVGGTKMVVGEFSRLGDRAILTSKILQVRTGEIIRSQRTEGSDPFAMADELSGLILRDLGFSTAVAKGRRPTLVDLTTSSGEAYALYLEGLDRYYRYDYAGAEESFRKAIAIDPGFALAYWRLAWMQLRFGMGDMGAAAATAEIAYGLRERLPEKERLYVEWLSGTFKMRIEESLALLEKLAGKYPEEKEAWFILAAGRGGPLIDPHKAIIFHQKWLALDSGFKAGYLFLVRDYFNLDELDHAAGSARRYIEIAPDDAAAHHMVGYVHYFKGELDSAMEEFDKTLKLDPQYYDAVIGQAQVLAKGGRFAESKEKLAPLLGAKMEPEHRIGASFQMGWNALAQKKSGEAEFYLKEMNKIILASHLDVMSPFGHYTLGWAYLTLGKLNDARQEFEAILERNDPAWGIYGPATSHYFLGVVALRMGQSDRASAEAEDLKQIADARDNQTIRAWHEDLMARIQSSQKSGSELDERMLKRPRFFARAWWGWIADIPGGIPLE